MAQFLAINGVVQIDAVGLQGFFRVVADDPKKTYAIFAKLLNREGQDASPDNIDNAKHSPPAGARRRDSWLWEIEKDFLDNLHERQLLSVVQVVSDTKRLASAVLSDAERARHAHRVKAMEPFLDANYRCQMLYQKNGLGRIVERARQRDPETGRTSCARCTVYRLWALLLQFGFSAGSLHPRFDLAGAPGVSKPAREGGKKVGRPCAAVMLRIDHHNQPGMSHEWRKIVLQADAKHSRPKPKFSVRYNNIVKAFSTSFTNDGERVQMVMPEIGTYPNKRQFRHLLDSDRKVIRALEKVTKTFGESSLRGYTGRSWEGVAGPGHTYSIDSTVGDVYLRSSINRAWIIGRPIVYVVVDIWSSAVVGFYVCLTGPAWITAKVALFSTFARSTLVAKLAGFDPAACVLNPAPGIPYRLLCDRGEYLSKAAFETGMSIGLQLAYAAPYRGDWKGLVEVLNRIAKDQQYYFVPGAFDARRKEMELRPDPKKSAFTLREYVDHLAWSFYLYNTRESRQHRLDATMIGASVPASPAGLWGFGHSVGMGYSTTQPEDILISALLPQIDGKVNREGIYRGKLQYRSELLEAEKWSTRARHGGVINLQCHHFPSSVGTIWIPHPHGTGLLPMELSDQTIAAPTLSDDELADAWMTQRLASATKEHQEVARNFDKFQDMGRKREKAIELTREAELKYKGGKPSIGEARSIESSENQYGTSVDPSPDGSADAFANERQLEESSYVDLMKKIMEGALR